MVQADDWLFPECIKRMVEVAEKHPSVGIVGAYELAGDLVYLDGLPISRTEVSGRDACRLYLLEDKYIFGSPTSTLLRSSLVRQRAPFYEERYAPFEDAQVCFDLMMDCNLGFVHQVLTFSRRDNGSIFPQINSLGFPFFFRLATTVLQGRKYLSPEEYNACLRGAERCYFHYLAKCACAIHGSGKEFWKLHRSALATIGYVLDWRILYKWVPRAILEKAWGAFWRMWDKDAGQNSNNGRALQQPEIAE